MAATIVTEAAGNQPPTEQGGDRARAVPSSRAAVLRTVALRILRSVLVLWLITIFAFGLIWLVPGNPAVTLAGEFASQDHIAAIEQQLGLDDPVVVQYGRWVGNAVQGDLGEGLASGRPVTSEITSRLPVTLSLTLFATTFGLLVAVPLGTIAALKRDTFVDRLLTIGSTAGVALPSFFVAILLVILVALKTDLFPATGYVGPGESVVDWIRHCTLPGIALGLALAAELARQIRSVLIEVLQSDYIRTARAKGVPAWSVLTKHAYKNASIPIVTILGAQIAALVGGTIIIEQVFAMPGVGRLAISAVLNKDIPIIQGIVVVIGALVLLLNTLVDLSYGFLDPRTRQ